MRRLLAVLLVMSLLSAWQMSVMPRINFGSGYARADTTTSSLMDSVWAKIARIEYEKKIAIAQADSCCALVADSENAMLPDSFWRRWYVWAPASAVLLGVGYWGGSQ